MRFESWLFKKGFRRSHTETLSLEIRNIISRNMSEVIKARYKNRVLKPLGEIDLKDGEKVEIELKKRGIFGLLKGWKIDSQSLKDELREINGQAICRKE